VELTNWRRHALTAALDGFVGEALSVTDATETGTFLVAEVINATEAFQAEVTDSTETRAFCIVKYRNSRHKA